MIAVAKRVDTGSYCTRKYAKNRATGYAQYTYMYSSSNTVTVSRHGRSITADKQSKVLIALSVQCGFI